MAEGIASALAEEFARQRQNNMLVNMGQLMTKVPLETAKNASFGDRLAAAMLPAILGGFVGGIGGSYEDEQKTKTLDAFARAYAQPAAERMAAFKANPELANLAPFVQLDAMTRSQALQDAYLQSKIQNQARMEQEVNFAGPKKRAEAQAEYFAQMVNEPGQGMGAPNEGPPTMDQYDQNGNPITPTRIDWLNKFENPEIKRVDSLRKEFTPRKENQYMVQGTPIIRSISESWYDKTPAGDLDFVLGCFKLADPESIVREGEAESARKTQAIPDWAWGQYQAAMGGAGIGDDARAKLLKWAGNRYEGMRASWMDTADMYKREAESAGIDPVRVVGKEPLPFDQLVPKDIWAYVDKQKGLKKSASSKGLDIKTDFDISDPDTKRSAYQAFSSKLKEFITKKDFRTVENLIAKMQEAGFSDDEIRAAGR